MKEFDLEEFVKMFDAALASNNPSVKKALRNFMMIAAVVHAEDGDEQIAGPLETLIKKVEVLENMIRELQHNRTVTSTKDYYKDYRYNQPTWIYDPNNSVYTGTSTSTSTTDSAFIKQLLKDVTFNDQ
jgi:hypothetical protein